MRNREVSCLGKKIKIRLINRIDYESIKDWGEEDGNFSYFPNSNFLQEVKSENWIDRKLDDENGLYFSIISLESNKIIGITILENIDFKNKNACWGIYIAYPEFRKLIFSLEPSYLIIEYAFHNLGLKKIYGNSLAINDRGRKFHKYMGFKEEAIFNNQVLINGVYIDLIWISILNEEWQKKRLELGEYVNSYKD